MNTTNFKVFAIQGVDFAGMDEKERDSVASLFLRASREAHWWDDEKSLRYSVLKCDRYLDKYVSGVLTQQHRLQRHLYDDKKQESLDDTDSYEDRLFVLDLQDARFALEWRQFRGKPPLSLPGTVERFQAILRDLLSDIPNSAAVQLVPFREETSKEEFLELFYSHRILAVEVSEFGAERVPDDVVLVNPTAHLEGALREILAHDFTHDSIGRLVAEARNDSEADLKRAAVVRAAIHSGRPKEIRYQRETGEVRVRRESENGIISIAVPVSDGDTAAERGLLTATIVAALDGVDLPLLPQPVVEESPALLPNYELDL